MITEQQLAEIEARANAATEGPWTIEVTNADFFAAARADVPALVAEVRKLREALQFYADGANYAAECDELKLNPIEFDGGNRAQKALGEGK